MAHRVSSADVLRLIIFRPRLLLSFRVLYCVWSFTLRETINESKMPSRPFLSTTLIEAPLSDFLCSSANNNNTVC